MKVVGLISGGKDSIHNLVHCVALGHEVVALANLRPVLVDEMDSFMYQTVGHEAIELIAESMGLPLLRREIKGGSKSVGMGYDTTDGDEVEDLLLLLQDVQAAYPDVEGVSVGAILSNYQRIRVEHVCARWVVWVVWVGAGRRRIDTCLLGLAGQGDVGVPDPPPPPVYAPPWHSDILPRHTAGLA
jgi:uncharacterized protein (TIGR00290 family)